MDRGYFRIKKPNSWTNSLPFFSMQLCLNFKDWPQNSSWGIFFFPQKTSIYSQNCYAVKFSVFSIYPAGASPVGASIDHRSGMGLNSLVLMPLSFCAFLWGHSIYISRLLHHLISLSTIWADFGEIQPVSATFSGHFGGLGLSSIVSVILPMLSYQALAF